MPIKNVLSALVMCCAVMAAADAAKPAMPPDLTGVWLRPMTKGFAFPDELPPVLHSLQRTEAAQAKYAEYGKLVPANPDAGPIDSAGAYCLGTAMPTVTLLLGGYPMEIIQRPEQIIFLYEVDRGIRRVDLKNRLDAKDLVPSHQGYSWGKWEGDTLVVETTAMEDTFYMDRQLPHGEQAVVIERYRMTQDAKGNKFLNMDLTMTDPESYLKPIQISTQLSFVPNGHLLDYECEMWEQRLEVLRAKAEGK